MLFAAFLLCLFISGCSLQKDEVPTDCDVDHGACSKRLAGPEMDLSFEISPRPVRTMKKLSFNVALRDKTGPVTDAEVAVSMLMPDMTMAENRIKLLHRQYGIYGGDGVIVRCPSGHKVWKAEVVIRRQAGGSEIKAVTDFTFKVDA